MEFDGCEMHTLSLPNALGATRTGLNAVLSAVNVMEEKQYIIFFHYPKCALKIP